MARGWSAKSVLIGSNPTDDSRGSDMKVFVLDNHDSKFIMRREEALAAIGYELDILEVGDTFTIECKVMTEEEVDALPEM
jgi:hypothetical protein